MNMETARLPLKRSQKFLIPLSAFFFTSPSNWLTSNRKDFSKDKDLFLLELEAYSYWSQ